MSSTVAASQPLIAGGKLRALAISSPRRAERLPEVPTVAETAVPGFEVYEWNGVFVPARTPPAIVDALHQAVTDALQDADVRRRFEEVGARPIGSTPARFAEHLKQEDATWAQVVRTGGIEAD